MCLACLAEGRARARLPGSLGREASEQVRAHRRARRALRGEPQAGGPRTGVGARHHHPRGRQGREGRDHGLRLVREGRSQRPLGPQPPDRRADEVEEEGRAEVLRRQGAQGRRRGREEDDEDDGNNTQPQSSKFPESL